MRNRAKESFLIIMITMFVFRKQKNRKWKSEWKKKCVCPTQRSKKCNVQKQNRTKRRKFVNGKDKRYLIFMMQQQQRQKQQRCESQKSFRLIQPFDPSILMQSNHKCFVSVSQTTYRTSAFVLTFFVEKYFITLLMETLFFFHSVLPNETIHLQTLFIFFPFVCSNLHSWANVWTTIAYCI